MKVKELIEELKKFDEELEVQYDYEDRFQTVYIEKVSLEHKDYNEDEEKIVTLY